MLFVATYYKQSGPKIKHIAAVKNGIYLSWQENFSLETIRIYIKTYIYIYIYIVET